MDINEGYIQQYSQWRVSMQCHVLKICIVTGHVITNNLFCIWLLVKCDRSWTTYVDYGPILSRVKLVPNLNKQMLGNLIIGSLVLALVCGFLTFCDEILIGHIHKLHNAQGGMFIKAYKYWLWKYEYRFFVNLKNNNVLSHHCQVFTPPPTSKRLPKKVPDFLDSPPPNLVPYH